MSALRLAALLVTNLVLTVVTAAIVGPSALKLQDQFGLLAWAARAPFYFLPLLLTPLTLWVRPKVWQGIAAGFLLAVPLALWAKATACPLFVQTTHIASACLQGALLSWLSARLPASRRPSA